MSSPNVFSDAAMAYAAFNLRDNYYREMARLVAHELMQAHDFLGSGGGTICEVGAGIGVSTLELLKILKPSHFDVLEPDASMRAMLEINMAARSGVRVYNANALNLGSWEWDYDAIVCCQMFHLLKDDVEQALRVFRNVLSEKGVLAFDLGPSNWRFRSFDVFDHRQKQNMPAFHEVVSELGHPLYGMVERTVRDAIKADVPNFDRPNLWPPAAMAYDYDILCGMLSEAGFSKPRITEHLVPISGERVLEFIRNGWSVFFRWPPLDTLPMERKLGYITDALERVTACDEFEELCHYQAYHPSAVITAQAV